MEVLIYTTPTCPYCRQAKEFLRAKGIPFEEKDVSSDPIAAQEMIRVSGQRGVPVLVIDGEVIVGFNRPAIEQALAGGTTRLGASVADAAKVAHKYGLGILQGVYVGNVNPGSPAERAGLQAGDVILAISDHPVHTAEELQKMVGALRRGTVVTLTVWRDGRQTLRQLAV